MNSVFEIENGVLKGYHGNDMYVTVPDNVTRIASSAFQRNEKIRQAKIAAERREQEKTSRIAYSKMKYASLSTLWQ